MNIHHKYRYITPLLSLAILISLGTLLFAGCQSAATGYKSNPEAVQLNEQGLEVYSQGNYERADMLFSRAAEADPKNPAIWFNKGQTLDAERKY